MSGCDPQQFRGTGKCAGDAGRAERRLGRAARQPPGPQAALAAGLRTETGTRASPHSADRDGGVNRSEGASALL